MHSFDLILTLTGGFAGALVFGYLTQRLGLSPIVGYLLAGVAVGPHTPGFVADTALAEQLAEVGVILLMFGVGLQFHVDELLAVRNVAIPGAVAQSAVATTPRRALVQSFGWSLSSAIVFGIALSVASTGRTDSRSLRQQCSSYPRRPYRGRMACRRRSLHDRRAGCPADRVRRRWRPDAVLAGRCLSRTEGRGARRLYRVRWRASDSARARPRCPHSLS